VEQALVCEECGKSGFKSPSSLYNHEKAHKENFWCHHPECFKNKKVRFKLNVQLKSHHSKQHPNQQRDVEKVCFCDKCNKWFKSLDSLLKHTCGSSGSGAAAGAADAASGAVMEDAAGAGVDQVMAAAPGGS
jgi:hypothetical protein